MASASPQYKEDHTMTLEPVHIGVDVAKEHLDVHVPGGKEWRVPNTPKGAEALLGRVAKEVRGAPVRVCCESTGGYERVLMEACWKSGTAVCRLNSWQVKKFAEATGHLEKSDKIDARVIARFAATRRPDPIPETPAWQRELRELWMLRDGVARERDAMKSRLEHLAGKAARRIVTKHVAGLERRIREIEKLAEDAVGQSVEAKGLYERYQRVKSVGRLTALAVLAEVPDLAGYSPKAAAKLAGVAPLCDQSGTRDGPRHIRKGRSLLRKALYMAALVAAHHNVVLAAFYRRLVEAGKPPKVAIVAVMRKLVVLLHRIASKPEFIPTPDTPTPA